MRFHLDEHVDDAIAAGLRRRGIDVTTTIEAGLQTASDTEHLAIAFRENQCVVTMDDDFPALASSGIQHCGIVYCHQQSRSVEQIIEFLVLLDACLIEDEMRNHVEFC